MSVGTPNSQEPGNALPGAMCSRPADTHCPASTAGVRHTISSTELLAGATAVQIEHLGQIYLLQTTRAGKLILTK